MDGKASRRQQAAKEKSSSKDVENNRPQRKAKPVERTPLPFLVAGKEVLGRELSVFKNSNKAAVWVKGAVKEFDEPSVLHKIQYEQPLPEAQSAEEEWLCLGKSMFMWRDENFICPFANPTYSAVFTPTKQDAVGKRVKVFWTAMGKWYQGKVVEFDSTSGKHRLTFRDGDEKSCLLRQEAMVWLDIPQLCSDTAIRHMRKEEGEPLPLSAFREAERKEEEDGDAQGSSSSLKDLAEKCKLGNKAVASNKRKQAPRSSKDQTEAQSQDRKRASDRHKGTREEGRPCSSGKVSSGAQTAASGSKEAPATSPGVETKVRQADGHAGNDSKSASSSSHAPEDGEPGERAQKKHKTTPPAVIKAAAAPGLLSTANLAASKAAAPKAATGSQKPQQSEEASRKRSRLGLPTLVATQHQPPTEPEPKRQAPGKAAKPATKLGRKSKKAIEDSRLGARRQKAAAELEFEEAGQAVMGARVGVWWEDDRCYYKGKIVAYDSHHKRLKILYDDGIEEFIAPLKKDTRLTWLTPRAVTAGATDAVHAAFQFLQAVNSGASLAPPEAVESGVHCSTSTPVAAGLVGVGHLADGSHLDALVPLRPSSALAGRTDEASGLPNASVPHPVDSTTRAVPSGVKSSGLLGVATPSVWPSAPLRTLSATPASVSSLMLPGLQAMVPPSSLPQVAAKPAEAVATMLHPKLYPQNGMPAAAPQLLASQKLVPSKVASGERQCLMTPDSGPRGKVFSQPAPQGITAEGWKVSIVFRGNSQIYQGRVLTYDAKQERHQVLWDDGEDEWLDATKEQLTWHADRLKTTGFSAGLPSGQAVPKGDELVGWRIAVYWKEEQQFYQGTVEDYDSELDQHTVSYNDGDELCESLCGQIFKFVLPPTVQAVTRRVGTRRRSESYDRDDGDRRPRRRLRHNEEDEDYQEEDSDTEWGKGLGLDRKPAVRQLTHLLHREACTPAVTTPRTCDIRRLNSKIGSLLVYEGEENHVDVTPGNSPKFSPRNGSLPDLEAELPDPRGQPLLDRRITSLKSAQGFRLAVKRVRVYLPGSQSAAAPAAAEAAQPTGDGSVALKGVVPCQESLKQMLARVDLAQGSMAKGIPAGSLLTLAQQKPEGVSEAAPAANATSSSRDAVLDSPEKPCEELILPESAEGLKIDAFAEEGPVADASEPPVQEQEEHVTPPPSPFATFAERTSGSPPQTSDGLQLEIQSEVAELPQKCCGVKTSQAIPVLVNGSLSLPQTPSAVSEGQVGPSRNGSIISAPMLIELAQAKAALPVLPNPEDIENVVG